MPIYEFRNTETDELLDVSLKISEYDQYIKDNPKLVRHYSKAPGLTSGTKSALTVAGKEWEGHLNRIKKGSGKQNTIKT
jgi:hypothetical protein